MTLSEVFRVLRRRWLIVVSGFAAGVALAAGAWVLVPATYERTATQVLMPGKGSLPKGGGNPYLYIGGLSQAADIVVRALASENIMTQIDETFPGVEVEVERDGTTPGPVILIRVSAASDSDAEAALAVMMVKTQEVLNQLQDAESISQAFRISARPVAVDEVGEAKRRMGLVISGGLLLAVSAGGLVVAAAREGLVGRRGLSDARVSTHSPRQGPPDRDEAGGQQEDPSVARIGSSEELVSNDLAGAALPDVDDGESLPDLDDGESSVELSGSDPQLVVTREPRT